MRTTITRSPVFSTVWTCSTTTLPLINFLYAAKRERAELIVVRRQKGSLFQADGADSLNWLLDTSDEIVDTTEQALSKMWRDLLERLKGRSALLQDYCAKHGIRMKEKDAYKQTFAYMARQTTPLLIDPV